MQAVAVRSEGVGGGVEGRHGAEITLSTADGSMGRNGEVGRADNVFSTESWSEVLVRRGRRRENGMICVLVGVFGA